MGLNRRQASQLREMQEQAQEVRAQGKAEWNKGKERDRRGLHGLAAESRDSARQARAEYERIQDEIDARVADPDNHSWNR